MGLQPAPAVLGLDMRSVVHPVSAHPMGLRPAEQHQRGDRTVGRVEADRRLRRRANPGRGVDAAAADARLHLLRLQIRCEHDFPVDLAVGAALLREIDAWPPHRRRRRVRRLRRPRPAVEILCVDPDRDLLPRHAPASEPPAIPRIGVALCRRRRGGGGLRAACAVAAAPSGAAAALSRRHFGLAPALRGRARGEDPVGRAGHESRGGSRDRAVGPGHLARSPDARPARPGDCASSPRSRWRRSC